MRASPCSSVVERFRVLLGNSATMSTHTGHGLVTDTASTLARIDHRFGNEGDFGRPERFSESFAIDPVQVE